MSSLSVPRRAAAALLWASGCNQYHTVAFGTAMFVAQTPLCCCRRADERHEGLPRRPCRALDVDLHVLISRPAATDGCIAKRRTCSRSCRFSAAHLHHREMRMLNMKPKKGCLQANQGLMGTPAGWRAPQNLCWEAPRHAEL